MPKLSATMTEGKVVEWTKAEGDKVKKGDIVAVVESDKADMDVEVFYDGYLARIVVESGSSAAINELIALLAENEEDIAEARRKSIGLSSPISPAPAVEAPKVEFPDALPGVVAEEKSLVATPHAKKLAKQYKADLSKISGTGPHGRIVPADVEVFAGKPVTSLGSDGALVANPSPSSGKAEAPPRMDFTVPFTGMQAAVSKNMVESLSVPTFRVGCSISTTGIDALYRKIKSKGVSMSVLLAKAAALALARHPVVNASCKEGKSFCHNSNINIAVAVAIDGGLITPVLQNADKADVYTLARKWKELVDKARAKQLQPQEYTTGTFTISNLGMFGVDRFDAILPPGQGAIMAVGAAKPTLVASEGRVFSVKNQMQVNVTADHRIIDGADLASFLDTFSKIVENAMELTL
ncbi:dihydrolipoyllysine-residue acetyltransferase component 4 of pyruvate dehydrogenase complex, chloroplastic-like [Selaginella moellendorffii]|uniref:dihydrolipoyllysine-residue acetyltransferase component 4 of pyruvate dehydrogenase complex, chloroplastic-like n=1 Tax=Selaginella moellendorffii TaxID=88036 RepID=UPI000D1C5E51|nr:dihydrolipoyllysine-residue acetyltransferase component 4 of pyruvate dehydrogenase complex, chloroplastic-like [Selaginella moellendorffii]|eukprot:XP_024531755.1 dihydrolipoyllysine-residue acetyltransferase component 4 of pyruvate dehydrogenase complex, chloroplastic-like [Selaginella moellendorffii]